MSSPFTSKLPPNCGDVSATTSVIPPRADDIDASVVFLKALALSSCISIVSLDVSRDVSADDLDADAKLLGIKLFFTTDAANDV